MPSRRSRCSKKRLVARIVLQKRGDDLWRIATTGDELQQLAIGVGALQVALQRLAEDLGPICEMHDSRFNRATHEEALQFPFVLDVRFRPSTLGAEERRLGNVDVAAVDQRPHLPIEERQQQGADVRAVDVCVGHDDDAVVPQLVGVEIFAADTASERGDHRFDLVAAQHFVEARLFDVQNLAFDGQNGLKTPIASLLCRSTGRLTLDDVQLALGGIALLTVGQFAWQTAAVEGALAPYEIACLTRRLTRPGRVHGLADDALRHRRILFEKLPELVVDDRLDDALDLGVTEFRLRLPFELRLRNLDADDAGQSLTNVVTADVRVLQILGEIALRRVGVDRARQRRTESGEVSTPSWVLMLFAKVKISSV